MPYVAKEKYTQKCTLLAKRNYTRVKNLRKNKTSKNQPHRSKGHEFIKTEVSINEMNQKEKLKKKMTREMLTTMVTNLLHETSPSYGQE